MRKRNPAAKAHHANQATPDELIEKITVDANGEAEQLWAFRQAFRMMSPFRRLSITDIDSKLFDVL